MKQPFRIRLRHIHEKSGLNQYEVARLAGINKNTVTRYIGESEVFVAKLEPPLIRLITFYGEDWRNPEIIDYIEDGE